MLAFSKPYCFSRVRFLVISFRPSALYFLRSRSVGLSNETRSALEFQPIRAKPELEFLELYDMAYRRERLYLVLIRKTFTV